MYPSKIMIKFQELNIFNFINQRIYSSLELFMNEDVKKLLRDKN
jgi:hypothetical protein